MFSLRAYQEDDPVVAKCIRLMGRYVREEEAWPDYVEKHKDNGRSFIFCRPFLTAVNLKGERHHNMLITSKSGCIVHQVDVRCKKGS